MNKVELAKRVMRSIAIQRPKPEMIRDAAGDAPMIIVTPADYARDVFADVEKMTTPDGLNVVVATPARSEILRISPNSKVESTLEISGDLSMGMLLIKMKKNPGRTILVKVQDSDATTSAAMSLAAA